MQRFADKVVLITGAASGIGEAAAYRLAEEGGSIFCTDINEEALQQTVANIEKRGGKAKARRLDISFESDVNACVADCVKHFGKLDVVVNMAGVLRFDNCHELALADWQRVIDVNLTGTFLLCKAVLPELLKTNGNIVNAASTASLSGLPWGTAYGASKGAVLAMTRTIAVEYAKRGVRANCVCPGDISTNMAANVTFPADADMSLLGRISSLSGPKEPKTVAGVIAMLASEDGIHITGEHIRVDGGTLS
ncbi:NAD(P)-dependent dehydrogenase (short-subunit alcohol dehydrogenase family) [Litorivivens lipolytica]|uniref:NAD(P)-dependent dehydrogenase (Short-subunit alcohol dehydrogenase family) n=1 Tax=Litorivivens lipolytica TaxID=1524264 RepID=A0A7W4W289_9GAMM|nr:SDR family oxidoreductase [Litorivivens lipolytica]MBB3045975.1 NAD(P)-dependent dehydrogenase (short-subunit alcohol dehydrogenase family) [Litorivivens lipolytica]